MRDQEVVVTSRGEPSSIGWKNSSPDTQVVSMLRRKQTKDGIHTDFIPAKPRKGRFDVAVIKKTAPKLGFKRKISLEDSLRLTRPEEIEICKKVECK